MAEKSPPPGLKKHETSDAEIKPVFIFIAGLGLFILVSMLAMSWMFDLFFELRTSPEPTGLFDRRQLPPEPRLQTNPAVDLRQVREREEKLLHSYQWIDKESGVLRIPIERAMEILAERGLPYREEAPESPAAAPERGADHEVQ